MRYDHIVAVRRQMVNLEKVHFVGLGHAVRSWLRHCATIRKVAGSIPDGVTGIFQ